MSERPEGAAWFGAWLSFRRESLGLSRRDVVRTARTEGLVVTPSMLNDFERGARIPTLRRLEGLARSLALPTALLSELALLAPRLEPVRVPREARTALSAARAAWLEGDHVRAAALAEWASRSGESIEAMVIMASSTLRLVAPSVARPAAEAAREAAEEPGPRAWSLTVLAELALEEGYELEAARRTHEAHELWEPAGEFALGRAPALLVEGRLHARAGARRAAAERFRRAVDAARACGAVALEREARGLVRQVLDARVDAVRAWFSERPRVASPPWGPSAAALAGSLPRRRSRRSIG